MKRRKRDLKRKIREIDGSWRPKLRDAKRSKDTGELSKLENQYYSDRFEFSHELLELLSDELVERAERHYIYPGDLGFAEEDWDWHSMIDEDPLCGVGVPSVWKTGPVGNRWLKMPAQRELRKRLHGADREWRRERREKLTLWMSLFFGFVGAIIMLLQAFKL